VEYSDIEPRPSFFVLCPIARHLTASKRITRRLSVQVLRRPWKRQLMENLDAGWSTEMWAYLADRPKHRARPAPDR